MSIRAQISCVSHELRINLRHHTTNHQFLYQPIPYQLMPQTRVSNYYFLIVLYKILTKINFYFCNKISFLNYVFHPVKLTYFQKVKLSID